MIDIAWKDHDANPASVPEEEVQYCDGEVYKIRPYGTYEVPSTVQMAGGIGVPSRMKKDERSLGINMRELNPQDIDKLVTVKGLVIRCTPIIPDMKVGTSARHPVSSKVDNADFRRP